MKQLVSDWLLDSQTEQSASNAFGEMDPKAEILSDKSKLLILMHLYLELRLNVEHAARADIIMATRVQSHHRWVEQPR